MEDNPKRQQATLFSSYHRMSSLDRSVRHNPLTSHQRASMQDLPKQRGAKSADHQWGWTPTDAQETTAFEKAFYAGKVCLHPAGELWGLTANPLSSKAMEELATIKGRPHQKPFLFLAPSFEAAQNIWQPLPGEWHKVLQRVWPAMLSVIWKKAQSSCGVNYIDTRYAQKTIGLRVQHHHHAWFAQFTHNFPHPIPSTSINLSGQDPLTDISSVRHFATEHSAFIPASFGQKKLASGDKPSSLKPPPSSMIEILDESSYAIRRSGCHSHKAIAELLSPLKMC